MTGRILITQQHGIVAHDIIVIRLYTTGLLMFTYSINLE